MTNAQKGFERAFAEEGSSSRSCWMNKVSAWTPRRRPVIGTKLSGLAMWPTLVCDGSEGTLIVSRGRNGEAQKSHWQTVLQLMSDEPLSIEAGDSVTLAAEKAVTKGDVSSDAGKIPASAAVAAMASLATTFS